MASGFNRKNLALGPANFYLFEKPSAVLNTTFIRLVARRPGVDGNDITFEILAPDTELSISVIDTAIVVTPTAASTAAEVIAALRADNGARGLVLAMQPDGTDGTDVVAVVAETPLAGGSETGVAKNVGILGDNLQVQLGITASPTTGAQFGTAALSKVITGTSVRVLVPFKEVYFDTMRRAIPGAVLFDDGADNQRIEFQNAVGQDMRDYAMRAELRPLIGNAETTDPKKIIVFPELAPADSDLVFGFNVTDQRVIEGNFDAYPNFETGRSMFTGDEGF